MQFVTRDDLPRGYWFHIWMLVIMLCPGIFILIFSSKRFLDIHLSIYLFISSYIISLGFYLLYGKVFPSWRESSKYSVGRADDLVMYNPVAGPIAAIIFLPILFTPLYIGVLSVAEIKIAEKTPKDVVFTHITFAPKTGKAAGYEWMNIMDDNGLKFSQTVEVGSDYEGVKELHGKVIYGFLGSEYLAKATILYGKVINGAFGNRYLLSLSREPNETHR